MRDPNVPANQTDVQKMFDQIPDEPQWLQQHTTDRQNSFQQQKSHSLHIFDNSTTSISTQPLLVVHQKHKNQRQGYKTFQDTISKSIVLQINEIAVCNQKDLDKEIVNAKNMNVNEIVHVIENNIKNLNEVIDTSYSDVSEMFNQIRDDPDWLRSTVNLQDESEQKTKLNNLEPLNNPDISIYSQNLPSRYSKNKNKKYSIILFSQFQFQHNTHKTFQDRIKQLLNLSNNAFLGECEQLLNTTELDISITNKEDIFDIKPQNEKQYLKKLQENLKLSVQIFGNDSFQYEFAKANIQTTLMKNSLYLGYFWQHEDLIIHIYNYQKQLNKKQKIKYKETIKKTLDQYQLDSTTEKSIKQYWRKMFLSKTYDNSDAISGKYNFESLILDNASTSQLFNKQSYQLIVQQQRMRIFFLAKLTLNSRKRVQELVYSQHSFLNVKFEFEKNIIKLYAIFEKFENTHDQLIILNRMKHINQIRFVHTGQVLNENDVYDLSLLCQKMYEQNYKQKYFIYRSKNMKSMGQTLNNMGKYLKSVQSLLLSQNILQQSKQQKLKYSQSEDYISIFFCLGIVFKNKKQYKKSLQYFKTTLKLTKKRYGPRSINCSILLSFIAMIYFTIQKYNQSLQYYFFALKIVEYNDADIYFVKYAEIAQKIGQIYKLKQQKQKSFIFYTQAMLVYKIKFGEQELSCVKIAKILQDNLYTSLLKKFKVKNFNQLLNMFKLIHKIKFCIKVRGTPFLSMKSFILITKLIEAYQKLVQRSLKQVMIKFISI